jgi:putative tryptophan/tyrosine transport system substrate-binding protein
MRRRQFITLLGGAAAIWPLAASAQQRPKMPTIGYLGATTASAQSKSRSAFLHRLRELGWAEGRNLGIEYRWAEGRTERAPEIATELVRLNVDIIFTSGAGPVIAAKQATSTIPIVFAVASDPVGTGLVASLARPGGNVTGLSYQGPDLGAKRVELLREVVPRLRRLAMAEIRQIEDITGAFDALKADALYVCADPLVNNNRNRIATLALGARVPTIYGEREHVEAGGLMSYGPNLPDLFRRAADYVDKILRGTKPADIPVEQPTKFDLVINLKTAKALGLEVPPTLLARADEVIE